MAEPAWQELLRLRLAERNAKEGAFASMIEQYRRLAQQVRLLKERNAALLRAVSTVKISNQSTSSLATTAEDNPVRAAYYASLDSQISSLRDELANLHRTHSQNTQKLLSMNEDMREKEELARIDAENLRKARDEAVALRRKVDQHNELMAEKDRTVQILHDEISTLQLELGQIELRNTTLNKDNAKLLQRWLDAKQTEANKMNEANEFYENMRSRNQAVLNWRDGAGSEPGTGNGARVNNLEALTPQTSESGNGDAEEDDMSILTKDGIPSPMEKVVDLTPNG